MGDGGSGSPEILAKNQIATPPLCAKRWVGGAKPLDQIQKKALKYTDRAPALAAPGGPSASASAAALRAVAASGYFQQAMSVRQQQQQQQPMPPHYYPSTGDGLVAHLSPVYSFGRAITSAPITDCTVGLFVAPTPTSDVGYVAGVPSARHAAPIDDHS